MLDYIYFYFELFAFFVCLYTYKKLDRNFKVFLPFLAFIVIYEFANIKYWTLWHHTNVWCYNLESIIETIIYTHFISALDKRKPYRKKVHIALFIIVLFSFIDMAFIQGFFMLNTIAMVLQNSMLTVLVCLYYFNLINNIDEKLDIVRYPPFWATAGILFYALSFMLYHVAYSYMAYKQNYHFLILATVIPDIACLILYSLLSVAFIYQYKKAKSINAIKTL
ncbi:hypothetical protein G7092_28470 [Mucilaginibacter sp. HC2]|uniref:hypothetical protein n=1 Tax=Mucilaginibacter inviolabilis TaxID=2714892 RepID=UPI00140CED1E|nr:hypothetical protein [Mucilaginibacter inviolabilis]NHA07767.1 hypothetical protein [Mucilaginibacter inviolabilis]